METRQQRRRALREAGKAARRTEGARHASPMDVFGVSGPSPEALRLAGGNAKAAGLGWIEISPEQVDVGRVEVDAAVAAVIEAGGYPQVFVRQDGAVTVMPGTPEEARRDVDALLRSGLPKYRFDLAMDRAMRRIKAHSASQGVILPLTELRGLARDIVLTKLAPQAPPFREG